VVFFSDAFVWQIFFNWNWFLSLFFLLRLFLLVIFLVLIFLVVFFDFWNFDIVLEIFVLKFKFSRSVLLLSYGQLDVLHFSWLLHGR